MNPSINMTGSPIVSPESESGEADNSNYIKGQEQLLTNNENKIIFKLDLIMVNSSAQQQNGNNQNKETESYSKMVLDSDEDENEEQNDNNQKLEGKGEDKSMDLEHNSKFDTPTKSK
jgi:hypothetical protein